MNRYAIWAVNAGLFALCCFLLAGVITEVGAARLAPEPGVLASAPAARGRPAAVRPDRSRILARNLFDSTEVAESVPDEEPLAEDLEETQLPLRLLGTAASEDRRLAWAAIDDVQERDYKVVAVGGEIRGASVVRIERKRVVLRNNGKLEELTLDEESRPGRVVARRPTRTPRQAARTPIRQRSESLSDRVRQVAENRFEVDSEDVAETVRNPASLFSEARILPRYEEGEMVGIQLNAIKEGSLFEEVGLQDGDTIVEFNGQSLGSPADSAQFLQQLIDGSGFQVLVRGEDGVEKTLTFDAQE